MNLARRDFLKLTAGGAALAALPLLDAYPKAVLVRPLDQARLTNMFKERMLHSLVTGEPFSRGEMRLVIHTSKGDAAYALPREEWVTDIANDYADYRFGRPLVLTPKCAALDVYGWDVIDDLGVLSTNKRTYHLMAGDILNINVVFSVA